MNIIIFLKQSNEVGSSYHMEKEGLQRSLEYLLQHEIIVGELVTHRHKQISMASGKPP